MDEKSLIRLLEKLAAHTEFRTLTKGEWQVQWQDFLFFMASTFCGYYISFAGKIAELFLFSGLPDPPMDVRVDSGPQDGTILVTW